MPKGPQGEDNVESIGGKGVMVKVAIDEVKDFKMSDDESKGMGTDGGTKEEQKSKSDRKTEVTGETRRNRYRTKSRHRDRERDSDKERQREGHRSAKRAKYSGVFTYLFGFVLFFFFFLCLHVKLSFCGGCRTFREVKTTLISHGIILHSSRKEDHPHDIIDVI